MNGWTEVPLHPGESVHRMEPTAIAGLSPPPILLKHLHLSPVAPTLCHTLQALSHALSCRFHYPRPAPCTHEEPSGWVTTFWKPRNQWVQFVWVGRSGGRPQRACKWSADSGSPGPGHGGAGQWLGQIVQTVWIVEEPAGAGPGLARVVVGEARTANYF